MRLRDFGKKRMKKTLTHCIPQGGEDFDYHEYADKKYNIKNQVKKRGLVGGTSFIGGCKYIVYIYYVSD